MEDRANHNRESFLDVTKFVAMFMVVLSHVIFYRPGFDLKSMPSNIMNCIMSVNMPIFFVLSGYFSRRLHNSGSWQKLTNRFIMYFWPLAFFSMIGAIIAGVLSGWDFAAIIVNAIKKFLLCGWFFYTLAGCESLVFLSYKMSMKVSIRIAVVVCGYVLCLVCSGRVLYAQQLVAMLPLYLVGLFLLPKIFQSVAMGRLAVVTGALSMIIATFFSGNIATNGLSFYWNHFDILKPTVADFSLMLIRYVVGSLGSLFVILAVRRLTLCFRALSRMAVFGTETLGVFYVHEHLIRNGTNIVLGLDASVIKLLIGAVIVFFASFWIVRFIRSNVWSNRIVWGVQLCG